LSRTKVVGRLSLVLALTLLLLPNAAGAASANDRGLLKLAGHHVKWGGLDYGSRAEVTYAFLTERHTFAGARNCGEMTGIADLLAPAGIAPPSLDREVAAAFGLWARAANLRFTRVSDMAAADIVIGAQAGSTGVAFTNVFQEKTAAGPMDGIGKATICLDPSERWEAGIDGDPRTYNLRYVLTHEIGHAIGLDHRGRDHGVMGFAYQEKVASPGEIHLADTDVAAAVRLYGPAAGEPGATVVAQLPRQPVLSSCSVGEPATAGPVAACGLTASGD
jgi:hypothetical protein